MTIMQRYGTVLRCYDNGGKTFDRYTIIPPRWAKDYKNGWEWLGIGASEHPFHPQWFGQHSHDIVPGSHLGRRICWSDLPQDVQQFARQSFPEYA